MEHLIDGVLRFQNEVYPKQKTLFNTLAHSQSPSTMFIGCSDSRVVPELFTNQGPGELFVVRNAGNIVPPSSTEPGGVTASIEYAVAVLRVRDIVLCGHSGCGAMTAILRGGDQLHKLPAVARWLHYADAARDHVLATQPDSSQPDSSQTQSDDNNPDTQVDALIRQNVLTQLDNLLTHTVVAEAVADRQLRLHGWVFDIGSGRVDAYNATTSQWLPLTQASALTARPSEGSEL